MNRCSHLLFQLKFLNNSEAVCKISTRKVKNDWKSVLLVVLLVFLIFFSFADGSRILHEYQSEFCQNSSWERRWLQLKFGFLPNPKSQGKLRFYCRLCSPHLILIFAAFFHFRKWPFRVWNYFFGGFSNSVCVSTCKLKTWVLKPIILAINNWEKVQNSGFDSWAL